MTTLTLDGGRLQEARWLPSPNYDQRPNIPISLLVIHGISLPAGEFGGNEVCELFTNQLDTSKHESFQNLNAVKVSAHFFIRRHGELIQFVDLVHRAWHAGQSSFDGMSSCNDFSIGIELEGTDTTPYTDAQYDSLVALTNTLCQHFPQITPERIVGHSHIAPGRKTDPGPSFNWGKYRQRLSQAC